MAVTVQFSNLSLCGGGTHVAGTGTMSPGGSVQITADKSVLLDNAPNSDDIKGFVNFLLWAYVRQLPGATPLQLRNAIESKVLDLTVTIS